MVKATHANAALDVPTVTLPIRVCSLITGIGIRCSLAWLKEWVCGTIDNIPLWVVADDAVTGTLPGSGATGAEERDVAARNRGARAGTGDRDAVPVNVGDIEGRTVILIRNESGFDFGVGRILGLANEDGPC